MKICKYIGIILISLASVLRAEVLVKYDFEGEVLTPSTEQSQITASDFGSGGPGATDFPAGDGSVDSYSKRGFAADDTLAAYFSFSVAVTDGFVANITNLIFSEMRSPTGPTNWLAKYSVDGSSWYNLGFGFGNTDWGSLDEAKEAAPAYLTDTIYFRIYGTNAASTSGSLRLDDVTLYGTVAVDDGVRIIRGRDYDGSHLDSWGATTNLGHDSTAELSSVRAYSGMNSLRLSGSTNNVSPSVVFANIDISEVSNAVLSVAFASDNVDTGDDLWFDISYDNGNSWNGVGSAQLVDGSGNFDLAFGDTATVDRVPVGSNPYGISISGLETEVAVRVRFQDSNNNNNQNDFYYIDDIKVTGVPVPVTNSPAISNYGGETNIAQSSATVKGLLQSGYPYPEVRLYWGLADGGTNVNAWNYEEDLGVTMWGAISHDLSSLQDSTVYYYRWYAENEYGFAWSEQTTNFTTVAGSLNLSGSVYVDSFGVGTVRPLSIDNDGDGLSDTWEDDYLGGTGSDQNADNDSDGVSNLREYMAGTDPDDTDSYMRLVSVDLSTPASADISIDVSAGDYRGTTQFGSVGDNNLRKFTVRASDSPGSGKSSVAVVADSGTGTNVWVDTNMVNEASARYYDVTVSYAGSGYTNREEWAAYVQPRTAQTDYKYLVSVPVDLGASNNLNSTLGQQLARGLYAGTDDTDSDLLYYRQADSTWKEFYLKDVAGTPVWTEVGGGAVADFTVTTGMGFWVVRQGSGARARTNCVFVGKSFTNAPTQAILADNSTAGWHWNVIGWPYATSKHNQDLGVGATPADQLGFVSDGGYGGTVGDYSATHEQQGDQIWVFEDNSFGRGYWLMDNIDADHNGRWAKYNFGRQLADFKLEPGKAYFYRHHVATNGAATGVNFNWKPEE